VTVQTNIYTRAPNTTTHSYEWGNVNSTPTNLYQADGHGYILKHFYGLNIFIMRDTCIRQNGHRETEPEHRLHRT
jgi:hypothetical protein